jgi:hypothetical protein
MPILFFLIESLEQYKLWSSSCDFLHPPHYCPLGPNILLSTLALGSTQPLTEMSTRNLPGVKGRPAHGDDNLTAICEPIV